MDAENFLYASSTNSNHIPEVLCEKSFCLMMLERCYYTYILFNFFFSRAPQKRWD